MSSDDSFVQFVSEQMQSAGHIRYRKMFGEYAVYCNEKVVALICDNRLFVKPTRSGREFIGDVVEAPPYKGAKPSFLIEDKLDDAEWLCELIALTEQELPPPVKKKRRK
ncbi:MAG: TfoX/Sxy family protein [Acidobacteriota bacterium]|jgi:TfoX/Sxy family transcriptional regulator of competence genes|nr:TfoX/Sxy family protein [Acidobacteriota bacterium]